MSLSVGIVGLPNVGKSTLFQAITKKQVDRSNYPFCTINPNVGVVAVPDQRLDDLARLINAPKKIYTIVEFVDIAGLVRGASRGEGLGNQFLANIRETDAIVYILRCFQDENVANTRNEINPLSEKEILDTEMALKDLETIEKRIQDLEREAKSGSKEAERESGIFKKTENFLKEGQVLIEKDLPEEERKILNNYQLLTLKPRLYLLNGSEKEITQEVKETFKKNNWPFLIIDVSEELEATELSQKEREDLGLPREIKIDTLIKECYKLLDLITFFTSKPDEVRAWTIKRGSKAPQAGGVVHSDFEKFFIKAEVISWQELIKANGFVGAREKGFIRSEGKEYIVQDGDVIKIKINK